MYTEPSTSFRSYPLSSTRYPWEIIPGNRHDNDCWNKSAFETLLLSVENGGEDPIVFIRDKIYGKHISGNHRWFIKERYRQFNKEKFD